MLRERLPVSPQTLRGGEYVRPVTEEADPAMTRRDQVGDGGARAADVVGEHRVGVDEPGRAVDEDQRDAGRAIAQQVGAVAHGAGDDQPVDAARAERRRELALALGLLVGAADQREDPALAGDLLHAPVHRAEERVRHVFEDQPDAGRLAVRAAQRAGREVVPVAQQLDRVAHAHDEVLAHPGAAVDHARHGAQAHAGDRRHLAHGRAPGAPGLHGHRAHGAAILRLQENDLKGLTTRFFGGSVASGENVVWRRGRRTKATGGEGFR